MAKKRKELSKIKKQLRKNIRGNQRKHLHTSVCMMMKGVTYVLYIFPPNESGSMLKLAIKTVAALMHRNQDRSDGFFYLASQGHPVDIDNHATVVSLYEPQNLYRFYCDYVTPRAGKSGVRLYDFITAYQKNTSTRLTPIQILQALRVLEKSGIMVVNKIGFLWRKDWLWDVARQANFSYLETIRISDIIRGKVR